MLSESRAETSCAVDMNSLYKSFITLASFLSSIEFADFRVGRVGYWVAIIYYK